MKSSERGQTLVEFLITAPLLALLFIGLFWVFQDSFLRWDCEKRVFEAARKALNHRKRILPFDPAQNVFVSSISGGVEAWCFCRNGKKVSIQLAHLGESNERSR